MNGEHNMTTTRYELSSLRNIVENNKMIWSIQLDSYE